MKSSLVSDTANAGASSSAACLVRAREREREEDAPFLHSSQMMKLASLPSKMLPTNGLSWRFLRSRGDRARSSASDSSSLDDEDELEPEDDDEASDSWPSSSSAAARAGCAAPLGRGISVALRSGMPGRCGASVSVSGTSSTIFLMSCERGGEGVSRRARANEVQRHGGRARRTSCSSIMTPSMRWRRSSCESCCVASAYSSCLRLSWRRRPLGLNAFLPRVPSPLSVGSSLSRRTRSAAVMGSGDASWSRSGL